MTLVMSKVIELTDANFRSAIDKAPLAFVDFYASWCGPCRLFSPLFEQVATRHSDAFFYKIDGDQHPDSRADLNIDNLPFIAVYRHGKLVDSISTTVESTFEDFVTRMKERAA